MARSKFGRNLPSPRQSHFAQIPSANIPRSRFNRTHGYKTTLDSGYLVPVFVDEALPGDTFHLKMTALARMATPLHPLMDNMYLDYFFFAVPYRLLWDNFERFCGAQTDPGDSTDYLVPQRELPNGARSSGSLSDYFGIPTRNDFSGTINVNALPFRAYQLIWNEWFRDQNMQDSVVVDRGDGPDSGAPGRNLQRRGKRHDYFTSALPWPQKGPSVELPLGSVAPVMLEQTDQPMLIQGPNNPAPATSLYSDQLARLSSVSPGDEQSQRWLDPNGNYVADLSAATAATINQIRQAFQVQKMYERDARGGTRYTEIILSHFKVQSPDARLQRPEYLGGGSVPINLTPIPSTATASDIPQGNLSAVGYTEVNRGGFFKSFTEHCVVIGLVNVRADLTYQQGLDRMWSRRTKFDMYWPSLAHLGEQAVLNKEIYMAGDSSDDDVFGYQERFAEYRYKPSKITGKFRSSDPQSLDAWHLSQNFANRPTLSSQFIEENPPVNRVIAVPSEPEFLLDCYFDFVCARPMPVYSVPGLVDHF